MKITIMLVALMLACFSLVGCDEPKESSKPKFVILEEHTWIPSKLTIDVHLFETQGIVVYVYTLHQAEIAHIAYHLYSETETWKVKDQLPDGPTFPQQLDQFHYRYNGYLIDVSKDVTLIRVGKPGDPPSQVPPPPLLP